MSLASRILKQRSPSVARTPAVGLVDRVLGKRRHTTLKEDAVISSEIPSPEPRASMKAEPTLEWDANAPSVLQKERNGREEEEDEKSVLTATRHDDDDDDEEEALSSSRRRKKRAKAEPKTKSKRGKAKTSTAQKSSHEIVKSPDDVQEALASAKASAKAATSDIE